MPREERTDEERARAQSYALSTLESTVAGRLRDCERAGCDFSEAESVIEDALGKAAW